MNKTLIFIFVALFSQTNLFGQINIIPHPLEIDSSAKGSFLLNSKTPIILSNDELKKTSLFLNTYLNKYYGFNITNKTKGAKGIYLSLDKNADTTSGAYTLNVNKKGITIKSSSEEGIFYGVQTLIQLLSPSANQKNHQIPFVSIKDKPRFGYRGAHLDVARHFFPVSFVKKYIDNLALHKINYFHWHLTEDQGWRIEIKKHPKLTEIGSVRNGTITGFLPGNGNTNKPHGGFYTQEDIKEIVKYASDRYITVIPEIEMPGHALAALTTYNNLGCTGGPYKVQETWGVFDDVFCAGNEETFSFLEDVIDEVIELFPSKYIHIGGDESPKANWKKCPKCQKRIKDNNLKDEHELQSYFVQRMEKYINNKGKSIIGWDEILEGGLAPNATVMSWRGEEGGIEAAKLGHDVIMTPVRYMYLDYSQTAREDSLTMKALNTVQKVYSYDPIPASLPAEFRKHILGAQANVWTEYMNSPEKVEYMIFPRMTAMSEVVWSTKENMNWDDFEKRLKVQFERYNLWKVNYSKAVLDPLSTKVDKNK